VNVSLPKEGTKEEVSMAMEETPVAIGMIIDFPGGTQEQYEAVLEQLNLGGRMAPGGIFHAAGPIDGGWRVVDVWESQQAFDILLGERLEQALRNAGMPSPEVATWPVYATLEPAVP
jgi:hypothetical protein